MADQAGSTLLLTRATCVGFVAFVLGTVGHATAGGLLPGAAWLVFLFAGAVGVSALFLSKPASVCRIAALLVGGQAVIHAVLSGTAGHVGDSTRSTAALLADVCAVPLTVGHSGASGGSEMAALGPLIAHEIANAPMMAAHALAAVGVALWLAVGERALWAVLAALRLRLRLVLPAAAPVLGRLRTPSPSAEIGVLTTLYHARVHTNRGPPTALLITS